MKHKLDAQAVVSSDVSLRIRTFHRQCNFHGTDTTDKDIKKDARLAKSFCIRVKEKASDYVKDHKPSRCQKFQALVELLTGKLHEHGLMDNGRGSKTILKLDGEHGHLT